MCGIIGCLGNIDRPEESIVSLAHRGPDGQGEQSLSVCGKTVWLGNTRLSILDLSPAGHQPMRSRDGRWWLTYNGEIYNHLALRKGLSGQFRGHSDTETLVELLATHGIEYNVPRLNGMFAFAAVDKVEGRLYLVRDPFGIKPLYYAHQGDHFTFASEIRALRLLGIGEVKLDQQSLQCFLTLRYIPSTKTLWHGIFRLPPGHMLCVELDSGKIRSWHYVSPVDTRFDGSLADAIDVYQAKLKTAVYRQLLSDVPVGILLSGGIDSSLIAAMAAETGRNIPCFTVGFGKEYKYCEIEEAAETAKILGLEHMPVEVNEDSLWDVFRDVIGCVEEPLGTTSILPMWYLVKKARENVTVVLTGQGNDEPWGGYRRYQVEILRNYLPFRFLYKAGYAVFSNLNLLPDFAERGLRSLSKNSIVERFKEAYALFRVDERRLLTGIHSDETAIKSIKKWLYLINSPNLSPVEQMMRIDTRMNLSDDLLLYGDKISMAFSLEARVPMLDIELVKFVESLPLNYKVSLNRTKIVHKLAAKKYLPEKIVNRPKKGFQVPFTQWSRGIWKDKIESVLFKENTPYLSYLNKKEVQKIWNGHCLGKCDKTRQIFALLALAFCLEDNS